MRKITAKKEMLSAGFEPTISSLLVRCLTNLAIRAFDVGVKIVDFYKVVVLIHLIDASCCLI